MLSRVKGKLPVIRVALHHLVTNPHPRPRKATEPYGVGHNINVQKLAYQTGLENWFKKHRFLRFFTKNAKISIV